MTGWSQRRSAATPYESHVGIGLYAATSGSENSNSFGGKDRAGFHSTGDGHRVVLPDIVARGGGPQLRLDGDHRELERRDESGDHVGPARSRHSSDWLQPCRTRPAGTR